MTCTSIRGRSHSRPDSEWPGEWRCESNSDVPESLGAKTNRLQRVLRGRSDAVHAVFVEFQGTVNPQGYHLRTPKNCPSAWGHLFTATSICSQMVCSCSTGNVPRSSQPLSTTRS